MNDRDTAEGSPPWLGRAARVRLAIAALLTVLVTNAGAQEPVIRIGLAAPTSGALAWIGKANENGARLAIEEFNAKPLFIGGRRARFELLAEDDAGDPKQGTAVAHKLVDAKVRGVIGHQNSGTAMPASRVYAAAGIPQISPSVTHPRFTRQGFRTTFRLVADDAQLGSALGRYVVQTLGINTFAVIDDRTAYGQGLAYEFAKAVQVAGGSVVAHHYTTDKTTDFNAILTAIKAKGPDAVFIGGMYPLAGLMIRQMKQLGLDAKVIGGDGICVDELLKIAAGTASDGQVICAEPGGAQDPQAPGLVRFKEAFRQRFGAEPEAISPYSYDAVQVMVRAMQKAGSADPALYLPVLAQTRSHLGVGGNPISFDEKGDLPDAAVTVYTFRQAKREVIGVARNR